MENSLAASTCPTTWKPNESERNTAQGCSICTFQNTKSHQPRRSRSKCSENTKQLETNRLLPTGQLDLVKVQTAAKYRTGQSATWGQGDWNGAPGGRKGRPPAGNGVFDQIDIIAAQQGAAYLTGTYEAISGDGQAGDGQTSVVYNPGTGELAVDAPAGIQLTSINIDSAAGIFTGTAAQNLGGSFDNDSDNNIFKATFGSSLGSLSFGNVAQPGLAKDFLLGDLTVVGSLQGGGALGDVDLVYVPEPSSVCLLLLGALAFPTCRRCLRFVR